MKRSGFVMTTICWLLVVGASYSFAQKRSIRVEVDWAVFRYDASQVLWEMYYSFPQKDITSVRGADNVFRGTADFRLKVSKGDSVVTVQGWKCQPEASDTAANASQKDFIDRIKLLLKPGDYAMTLRVQDDSKKEKADSVRFNVRIEGIPDDKPALSDVEMAFRIQKDVQDKTGPFYKNTLSVIPNPSRLYGKDAPFLYFYAESYNLMSTPSETYALSYTIKDANSQKIAEIEPVRRIKPKKVDSSVEWGAVKVSALNSGKYIFHLGIGDTAGNEFAFKEVPFYVFNPERVAPTAAVDVEQLFLVSEFYSMPEAIIDAEFKKAEYISTKDERNQYKKIKGQDEKRKWIFKFWKSRDTNLATPMNEYRAEYMARVEHADQTFRSFMSDGWKTDRGRVYIVYGDPDYIEPHPNEHDFKPYEIWTYDQIEGGILFIFGDANMNKEYRLLHSTKRGELQNTNWEQELRKIE